MEIYVVELSQCTIALLLALIGIMGWIIIYDYGVGMAILVVLFLSVPISLAKTGQLFEVQFVKCDCTQYPARLWNTCSTKKAASIIWGRFSFKQQGIQPPEFPDPTPPAF